MTVQSDADTRAPFRICEVSWARSERALVGLRRLYDDAPDGEDVDALDRQRKTRHFAAYDDEGDMVGALRFHPVQAPEATRYGLARLIDELSIYTVSRLVLDPAYRHTTILHRLYEAVYARARSLGVDAFFADVSPERVMMYEALGFFRSGEGERVGDEGFRVPMLLDLADVEYLRKVGSPLFATAQRYLARSVDADRVAARLGPVVEETRPPQRATVVTGSDAEAGAPPRSGLTDADDFRISGILGRSPRQVVARGMPIGRVDVSEPRYHVVVAGTVGVLPPRKLTPVAYLGVGDAIVEGVDEATPEGMGDLAYVALTECTVASLSESDLARLATDDPQLATSLLYKVVTGLARRVEATTQMLVHDHAPGPRTLRVRGAAWGAQVDDAPSGAGWAAHERN